MRVVIRLQIQIDMLSFNTTSWIKHKDITQLLLVIASVQQNCLCILMNFILLTDMEPVFVEHLLGFDVTKNMHNVLVVTPHDLRCFKPFDV